MEEETWKGFWRDGQGIEKCYPGQRCASLFIGPTLPPRSATGGAWIAGIAVGFGR